MGQVDFHIIADDYGTVLTIIFRRIRNSLLNPTPVYGYTGLFNGNTSCF